MIASFGIEPSTTSTNGSSSPRSALKNHSMKSSAPPTGPHSKSISGQWTAIFGRPGQGAEGDLLDARLGRRGQGDRVAVAAQPGVDPQDVDRRSRPAGLRSWSAHRGLRQASCRAMRVRDTASPHRPTPANHRRLVNECVLHPLRPSPSADACRMVRGWRPFVVTRPAIATGSRRCRRAWDLGARGRARPRARSTAHRPTVERRRRVSRAGGPLLPRHVGVGPLDRGAAGQAALDRQPAEATTGLPSRSSATATGRRRSTTSRRCGSSSTSTSRVPDPVIGRRRPRDGDRRRRPLPGPDRTRRGRRRRRRYWLLVHRLVRAGPTADELALDERSVAGVLGLGADRAVDAGGRRPRTPSSATRHRRTFRRTRRGARAGASRRPLPARLGRTVAAMLAIVGHGVAVDPTPGWSTARAARSGRAVHRRMMQRRAPTPTVAARRAASGSVDRADVLEEGRLGGVSWGMGRGAAAVRLPDGRR